MKNNSFEKKGKVTHNSNDNEEIIAFAEKVDFTYENSDSPVFENLNFSFEKNSHNLILGPNGSGKSTLIGLMTGIFIPNEGTITINGSNFSYVGPVPLIFNDSLLANLSYGVEEKNIQEEVFIEYLEKFNVFDQINRKKLDESITHRSLSSGQMQKVSFIRALLREPDILFLDEAISNIDKKSIEKILTELNKFKGTVVNITHNPERYINADKSFQIIDKQLIEKK